MFYTIIGGIILIALVKDLLIDAPAVIRNEDLPDYDDDDWDGECA